MKLTVRRAVSADVPAMVELMRQSLGDGDIPRTAEFFRWKHFESPFGVSPILLAESDGRLAGLRTFLRWELRKGGRTLKAVRAVDTSTHPDFRGQGIFRRLTTQLVDEMKAEGVDFVFNTPNEKSGPGYLKMGWERVGPISVSLGPRLRAALKPFVPRHTARPITDVERNTVFDCTGRERVAGWVEAEAGGRGHTARTVAYLRWRYASVPGIPYGAVWAPDDYLIIFRRRIRRGFHELTVCEFLVAPGTRALGRAVVALHRLGRGSDVVSSSALFSRRLTWALRAVGHLPVSGPLLFSRELASAAIAGFDDWAWSLGDLEVF